LGLTTPESIKNIKNIGLGKPNILECGCVVIKRFGSGDPRIYKKYKILDLANPIF